MSRHRDPNIPYGPEQKQWGEQVPAGADLAAPSDNPIDVYPVVPPRNVHGDFPHIDYARFEIPPTGLTDEQREAALGQFREYEDTQHGRFMGYQATQDQSYSKPLSWLLDMHSNNIGDPFTSGYFTLNSKFAERAVLDYFAALWNCDWPHRDETKAKKEFPERYWGYVLTMGCTEANIYGLYNARDYLKGRTLIEEPNRKAIIAERVARGKEASSPGFVYTDPIVSPNESPKSFEPIIFYSEDVHYSVVKAVRLLEIKTFSQVGNALYPGQCPINDGEWPVEVPSHNYDVDNPLSGTVKVDDLEKLVRFFVDKGHPPIIVANVGTTWKGAYDDVPAINQMLEDLGKDFPWLWERPVHYDGGGNGSRDGGVDIRRGFWLHVDGALGAPFLPFIETAHNQGKIAHRGPIFDFRNRAVMSIGCSMHKWIGGPWPSGIYMTRTKYQLLPPDDPGLIGSADTTLGGSRSGFSPMIFWDYFSRMSHDDNVEKALQTDHRAEYLLDALKALETRLQDHFDDPNIDLWIARSRLALTVRFRLVNPTINYRWTLDQERLSVPISEMEMQERSYSHVFLMHSVTVERIDALVEDIWTAATANNNWHDAFPAHDGALPNPGPKEPITTTSTSDAKHRVAVPLRGRGWGAPTSR